MLACLLWWEMSQLSAISRGSASEYQKRQSPTIISGPRPCSFVVPSRRFCGLHQHYRGGEPLLVHVHVVLSWMGGERRDMHAGLVCPNIMSSQHACCDSDSTTPFCSHAGAYQHPQLASNHAEEVLGSMKNKCLNWCERPKTRDDKVYLDDVRTKTLAFDERFRSVHTKNPNILDESHRAQAIESTNSAWTEVKNTEYFFHYSMNGASHV